MTDDEVQSFLDDITTCFVTNTFQLWADRITLPFTVETKAGPILCKTNDDLRENFDLYMLAYANMDMDTVFRRVVSCEPTDNGGVALSFETDALSKGKRTTEPYIATALLTCVDGKWRMHTILNGRGHHAWTAYHPHKSGRQT